MDVANIWFINLTMEVMSIVYLTIILCACIGDNRKALATRYLVYMAILEILILCGQIAQRLCLRSVYFGNENPVIIQIVSVLFCIDYILMYSETVIYYIYIGLYLQSVDGYVMTKNKERIERFTIRYLIIIGIISSIFFASSIWNKQVFYITQDGFDHYTKKYYVLLIFSMLSHFICIRKIASERRYFGMHNTIVIMLYLVARYVLIPIDLRYDLSISYNLQAIVVLIFFLYLDRRQGEELQQKEKKIILQQIELEQKRGEIMVSQIQPHFLYNTLSVIDYLCGKDVKTARLAIAHFSDYLRMNMESISNKNLVMFEKELEHTKNYLWIEELRFSDILKVEYEIEESHFMIPPLTLQPLCENAVKHGIRGKDKGGTVIIRTQRQGDKIIISVEDDGIGFDADKALHDGKLHVGIENVRGRLAMLCDGTLKVVSNPGKGTTATITLHAE